MSCLYATVVVMLTVACCRAVILESVVVKISSDYVIYCNNISDVLDILSSEFNRSAVVTKIQYTYNDSTVEEVACYNNYCDICVDANDHSGSTSRRFVRGGMAHGSSRIKTSKTEARVPAVTVADTATETPQAAPTCGDTYRLINNNTNMYSSVSHEYGNENDPNCTKGTILVNGTDLICVSHYDCTAAGSMPLLTILLIVFSIVGGCGLGVGCCYYRRYLENKAQIAAAELANGTLVQSTTDASRSTTVSTSGIHARYSELERLLVVPKFD